MTGSLLVLGCGGHGRVVADVALDCGYERIAFLDDAYTTLVHPPGFPVLGPFSILAQLQKAWPEAIAAVGDNRRRFELFRLLCDSGYSPPALVHPSASVSRTAQIGRSVLVMAGAVVNTGATLGDAVIVNSGAVVDHDCVIGAAGHIAPGASLAGDVRVGERTLLGTGCAVRPGLTIAGDVVVGVGAAVVADLLHPGTYAGVPARLLRQ